MEKTRQLLAESPEGSAQRRLLDAALIREIPDAVAAKAAAQRIYDKLSAFSVG